jgi:hypothetical protein
MCPRRYFPMKIGEMTRSFFEHIVCQLPHDATILPFWRGESSLHPKFESLMLFARQWLQLGRLVVATNGILTDLPKILGFAVADVVTVSIHNPTSWQGMTRIISIKKQIGFKRGKVCASMVEGEKTGVTKKMLKCSDEVRIYEEHTKKGRWGSIGLKVKNQGWCSRLDTDLVVAWDGSIGRCCYVWEPIPGLSAIKMTLKQILDSPQIKAIRDNYPDKICRNCSQWQGNGKTL